ncbi:hypothetical protein TNCV_1013921 [Trichonephila clavipes]|uniref:Uncharacterized protein n=1 Tax=Trichonephila clavipes TaxID=2585209 RepID=A0A8X6VXL2_TRICX|nr:hypothetical protein TNCV_1013921 [Trichonephila clavipes]
MDPEVHEQMYRSGGQYDVKPPVLSSQAGFGSHFIDPLKGSKAEATLPSPWFEPQTCGVETLKNLAEELKDVTSQTPMPPQ